jgi:uncharacterized protein (TIRG00374 family)
MGEAEQGEPGVELREETSAATSPPSSSAETQATEGPPRDAGATEGDVPPAASTDTPVEEQPRVGQDDDRPTPHVSAPRVRRRWLPRNVKITLMILVLFFIGEYILLPELASARREFHRLTQLNFIWLVLGALLEVAALAAYAQLTHTVLSPGAPKRFTIFRINMWALAVSHVLPGGTVPGTAASYRLLTESEVSGSTAAFGLAAQGIGSAVVLNIIFWLALLISIPLRGYNPLYGFAALLGVLLIAIFGGLVFFLTRGEKQAGVFLQKIAHRFPFVRAETITALVQKVADRMKILSTSSQLLSRAGLWAAANWLLDAASLYVFLLAFGARPSPIDVLVAYGLANILAVIPLTPSGLGVVELTIVAVLKGFGVPGDVAAAGVLTWRLVNFWLPIPFGGISYFSLRIGHSRVTTGAKAITS